MAIFEISFDSDSYQALRFLRPDIELSSPDWQQRFIGHSMQSNWRAVEVDYEALPGKAQGDFPSLGGIPPVFSSRAVEVLGDFIADSVEFLPLAPNASALYAVNVINICDCLDITQSQVIRFSSGRIMRIEKYVFKEGCLSGAVIFKLPEQIRNRVYVSELFKQVVEKNNLRGMLFTKVGE